MKANSFLLPCPKCGKQFTLFQREVKRDRNLKLTCLECGYIHLAMNAIQLAVYNRMKEQGYPVGEPPVPEPIDPITVLAGKDGTEIVIRRNKTTGARIYTRRAKPKR